MRPSITNHSIGANTGANASKGKLADNVMEKKESKARKMTLPDSVIASMDKLAGLLEVPTAQGARSRTGRRAEKHSLALRSHAGSAPQ